MCSVELVFAMSNYEVKVDFLFLGTCITPLSSNASLCVLVDLPFLGLVQCTSTFLQNVVMKRRTRLLVGLALP